MMTSGGSGRARGPREDVQPAHARQPDVQEHEIERAILQQGERLGTIAGGFHGVAGVPQQGSQHEPQCAVIVHEQDAAAGTGRVSHDECP